MAIRREDLPSRWIDGRHLDQEMRSAMPLELPPGFWWRAVEDPKRGFPALHTELAWVANDIVHFCAVAGFTDPAVADGVDEREVIQGRRVPMGDIGRVNADMATGQGTVTLRNGTTHEDWPAFMIWENWRELPA